MKKTQALFLIVLFINFQFLNVVVNSSATFQVKKQETLDPYRWFWEELSNPPGPISGEDVVYWGEDLGPYHNYTELTDKLVLLNATFPEIVDVFSIGKTWHNNDVWCVKLTNETVTSSKTEYYIVAEHHARELISVENALYFIDKIVYDSLFGLYEDLLSSRELYIIPMLNPDGISIIHWFPEQRKNLHPIDDDGDGLNDTDMDGLLDDELERTYYWDSTANTSAIRELDLDGDGSTAEDLPGGVDLNRNYGVNWEGTGSSAVKIDSTYRGAYPFSEYETQIMRDFMREHAFNFAISLHSGIQSIITPWGHNNSLPIADEDEFNALLVDLQDILHWPLWNESIPYPVNGVWDDFCYAAHDIMCFTLETYGSWMGTYFDSYNPPGNQILSNCEYVYPAMIYLAEEPRLTYSNNLPSIIVTNPSTVNQVFENYTINWTMDDLDGDDLNCTVLVSENGWNWDVLGTNLTDQTSFFWNVTAIEPGSYYLKVAVYDGKDWISDISEIRLNVRNIKPPSPFAFYILAGIFGTLAVVYLFFYIRKSKGLSKMWGPENSRKSD
ncbi:MAG: M14 family zinc carboxypeptidase [Candidatus Heimdallarchaeaceae archaeon]